MPLSVSAASLTNPLAGDAEALSVAELIGRIVQGILGITGVLALVFVILGGVTIIFAAGNADKVEQGKKTLLYAFIGTVIAFGGFVIMNTIIQRLTQAF